MQRIKGVFVTGTDTNVGKTLVSAVLTTAWHGCYWKPFQTGLAHEPGDTATVKKLANLPPERIIPPYCALQAPLSPLMAARKENYHLEPASLSLPETDTPLIVEGAGGLMVPITRNCLMIDFIAQLGLPVLLVARPELGTINHTLLSLEALSRRRIPVCGFMFNGGGNLDNQSLIEVYSHSKYLFHLPFCDILSADIVAMLAQVVPPLERMTINDSVPRR